MFTSFGSRIRIDVVKYVSSLFLLLTLLSSAFASDPTWAKKAIAFPSECDRGERECQRVSISSPDGMSSIQVKYRNGAENRTHAYLLVSTPRRGTRRTELPSGFGNIELLWSPDSRTFFVNGGNGGQYWGFWVYVYAVRDPKLQAHRITDQAHRDMVKSFPPCRAAYLDERDCKDLEKQARYSNMSGIDWVSDSSAIIVMAEVPCSGSYGGIMCQVLGYELEVPTGRILKRMTATQLATAWQDSMAWKFRIPDPPDYAGK